MSDIVDRLREQSTVFNSPWVMKLFAEAGDHVEHLEQEITRLKTLINANYGKAGNVKQVNIREIEKAEAELKSNTTWINNDPYDDAMEILK